LSKASEEVVDKKKKDWTKEKKRIYQIETQKTILRQE